MEELENKIKLDREINLKCLQEETTSEVKAILKLWIKYDEELLSLIKKTQIESKGE